MDTTVKVTRKSNPARSANPISKLTFAYMFNIFRWSYKHKFKEEDLFEPLPEHTSNRLGNSLEQAWKQQHRKHKKLILHRALLQVFGLQFFAIGVIKLLDALLLVTVIPLALGGLVSYFENGPTVVSENEAYMYTGLIVICLLTDTLVSHPVMMVMMHIAMKLRVACSSVLYRKCLRLNRSSLAKTTVGQIVNLLSNDVSKFDSGFVLVHFLWVAPIQTAVGTYLMYREIGYHAIFGICLLVLCIPIQMYIGKRTSTLRLRTAHRTDERVRLMDEILSGIQVIKVYTWEKPFAKLVSMVRRLEIKAIREHSYLLGFILALEMLATRTAIFISIVSYVLMGNEITAKKVFAVTGIYSVIRVNITSLFSLAFSALAEVYISICRVQQFLNYEELPDEAIKHQANLNGQFNGAITNGVEKVPYKTPKVVLTKATAKWLEDSPENSLTDVNINISDCQLIAIIGPVGSGKSSIFNIILKELSLLSGSLEVDGKISYASQEPWLFSASARQNILFGNDYDEERYRQIVKVCALESDFEMLSFGDRTIVGEKGKSLSGGQKARVNLARCIYKKADIYLLDDPLSAVDTKVGKQLYEECITKFLRNKICILITHQLQYLNNTDKIIILKEGEIIGEGTYNELQTTGLDFAKLLEEFHTDAQETENRIKSRQNSEQVDEEEEESAGPEHEKEFLSTGSIKAKTYGKYFRAGGNYFVVFLVFAFFVIAQIVASAGDYYVTYWVNLEQQYTEMSQTNATDYEEVPRNTIIYTYSAIIVGTVLVAIFHNIFFFWFLMRASVNLHDHIFSKISNATMKFFNTNPTGRILNRFSRDVGIIDEYIPPIINDVIEIGLILFAAIVLSSIVNPWLLLPSLGILLAIYLFRCVYIKTSRSVKRIEAITRSPIFNHMSASIQGLATIRAFSAQNALIREFEHHQDLHSSAWFLYLTSNRAFGLWIDVMCIVFISLVTISLLVMNRGYFGGDVGLIITQYFGLMGGLQWGMRQWSELENNMTSVERILEYTKVETEPERKLTTPLPKSWPEHGKIEFQNLSLRYDGPLVLKSLNFTIHAQEKVGIVGRTGAGKSSTIAALFQLYNVEGTIVIDGVDTTKIPLVDLRSKLSIIPQEPVLFSGTMRKNLDPFDEYNDEILWQALEQVELKEVIAELPSGLNSNVSEGGSNFSVGQRQLVCLARAIIRNNKILVMDEATANVDPHTDALIQKTIRRQFLECTVITIAHRLHTIMDSDKVLVMSGGMVADFDHPHILLQDKDGIFYNMVETTGATTAKNLRTIAEQSFTTKKSK